MSATINVRLSDASTFSVSIEVRQPLFTSVSMLCTVVHRTPIDLVQLTQTVSELKNAIAPLSTPPCPPELQKLVYKGRILKDGDTLESYGACVCLLMCVYDVAAGTNDPFREPSPQYVLMCRSRGWSYDSSCQVSRGCGAFRYGGLFYRICIPPALSLWRR